MFGLRKYGKMLTASMVEKYKYTEIEMLIKQLKNLPPNSDIYVRNSENEDIYQSLRYSPEITGNNIHILINPYNEIKEKNK